MIWIDQSDRANVATVPLGYTLPALLDAACIHRPNATAINQWTETGWQSLSNQALQATAETIALGLLNLGLENGDRVALLIHSDVHFVIADMGCLLAHLVDVPIDLTQTIENIIYILQQSEAKVFIISNLELFKQIQPYLKEALSLQYVVVATPDRQQQTQAQWVVTRIDGNVLQCPQSLLDQPSKQTRSVDELRAGLSPQDLATIIYIPGATGQLLGVMLTHENLSGNALAAFSTLSDLEWGANETVLTFLPLTHVFARGLLYGHLYYGHSIYLSNPNRILKHLKEIQPTILASVPLLIEKIYSKILEQSHQAAWWERLLFSWALQLARRYQLGQTPRGLYATLLKVADWLVLSQWRAVFGGRLKYLISGGAALKAELANGFAAAGVMILQGYGLTQAGIVCCNRGSINRAGTVGLPIPGVELAIATDQEILVRSPYVTPGYYQNPAATQAMIDQQGWLHTGDLGALTAEGLLQITGIKKALFKLSTGKYIAPQPIEDQLKQSPFVSQAIVVGSEQKFCAALIVLNLEVLSQRARELGLDLTHENLLQHPWILALYQAVVESANCHLPYWSIVKRFTLIQTEFTVENELLTPLLQVNRSKAVEAFAKEIADLYKEAERKPPKPTKAEPLVKLSDLEGCPTFPTETCPPFAQSLNPRLTT